MEDAEKLKSLKTVTILIVGWFILAADAIWIIYRIVKGWLNLSENRPMP